MYQAFPSPICPRARSPQHHARPTFASAQVLLPPAEICENRTDVMGGVGTNRSDPVFCAVLVPSTIAPNQFPPQHLAAPSGLSAHVWTAFAATPRSPLPPTTMRGVD